MSPNLQRKSLLMAEKIRSKSCLVGHEQSTSLNIKIYKCSQTSCHSHAAQTDGSTPWERSGTTGCHRGKLERCRGRIACAVDPYSRPRAGQHHFHFHQRMSKVSVTV